MLGRKSRIGVDKCYAVKRTYYFLTRIKTIATPGSPAAITAYTRLLHIAVLGL
jgi:hypothetical protein